MEFVLRNDRLRNTLIDLATKAEVEWYPSSNVLTANTLSAEVRQQLTDACEGNTRLNERLDKALKELDEFVVQDTLNTLGKTELTEAKATLTRLLRDRQPPNAAALTFPQFVEAAYDDLLQAADLNYTEDPEGARSYFRRLRRLRDQLQDAGFSQVRELSMGMTHDFAVAIEEGATMVRIGTAIFGPRNAARSRDDSPATGT